MGTSRVLGLILLLVAGASPARAAVTCEEVSGAPPDDTTVRIVIESPADGTVLSPRNACGGKVVVTGSFLVDAPPPQYDFYIVIDSSGSTINDSGADVNGNGIFGERADSIYMAELQAAQDFVRAVDPAASRCAVIRFSSAATLRHQLTTDLPAVIATLETMKSEMPTGGTYYIPAMEAVRLEMEARGDLSNRRQRCVFLSDGVPSLPETVSTIEAKATELAGLGLVMDTFALGAIDSEALRSMATVTRGTFTALAVPGDIVDVLPSFIPDVAYTFESIEEISGAGGIMVIDEAAGTFEAIVNLRPGPNRITLTIVTSGAPPVMVTCSIDITVGDPLFPDAGPSGSACGGNFVTLDASRSTAVCAAPVYRWVDCNGNPLADWSSSPTLDVEPCRLACETVTLELSCPGDACFESVTTTATCVRLPPPVPALVAPCGLQASLACGVTDPGFTVEWDLDPAVDSDGDGDPANDADASGCDVVDRDFGSAGLHEVVTLVSDPSSGCTSSERFSFTLANLPAPRNIDGGACLDIPIVFSCGTPEAGLTYWWDFDATTDGDFDGDPTNDRDVLGCDAARSWPAGGDHEVSGWAEDAAGCRRLVARGVMTIAPIAIPGEVQDLRVSRAGDAVTLTWTAVAGASAHRVLRGPVVPLQSLGIYDHAADDGASRGACIVAGLPVFTDPNDVVDPTAFYYLVTAINECDGEGTTGQGFDGEVRFDRPPRTPTVSCP